MRCLKSIAYILLFSFSVLFVGKTSSVKSAFSEIEKQLDDIEKNVDVEDNYECSTEKSIEDDDITNFVVVNRTNSLFDGIVLVIYSFAKVLHFPNAHFCRMNNPIIGIFTPPPNF